MGTITYGNMPSIEVPDDRTLLHLQIVIVSKLRRGERFLFRCDEDPNGRLGETFWMSPSVPLKFSYTQEVRQPANPLWLRVLAHHANSPAGLWIAPEPPAPTTPPRGQHGLDERISGTNR